MAPPTAYETYVPTLQRGLEALTAILKKAEAHAQAHGLSADAEYAPARLAPDMLPLTFQVQNLSNTVKKYVAAVAGVDPAGAAWADDEKTFADLYARVDKTVALLRGLRPEQINNGKEDVEVEIQLAKNYTIKTTPRKFAAGYVTANFFFHLVTAYDILRAKGVPVGKRDYITSFLA